MINKQKFLTRLIYLTAIGIVLGTVFLAFSAYYYTEKQVVEQFNRQQLILAQVAAVGIEDFTGNIENNLYYLGRQIIADPQNARELISNNWQILSENLLYILYLDSNGKLLHYLPEKLHLNIESDYREKDFFSSLLKRENINSAPYISNVGEGLTGRSTIIISRPLYDSQNKFQGAVCAAVNLDKMLELFLSSINTGKNSTTWLLDNSGNLLYHPQHKEMVGNSIFELGGKCEGCHLDFRLERSIIAESRAGSVVAGLPDSSHKRLMAYCPIKIGESFWFVAVESPYAEVISLIKRTFSNTLFMASMMVITIFLTAWYIIYLGEKKFAIELRAKELKELLEGIFENAPLEITIINNRREIIYVNKYWERAHAKERALIEGKSICEGMPDICAQASFSKLIDDTFQNGEGRENINISVAAESGENKGKQLDMIYWTVPVFDFEKKVVRCAFIGYNITQIKNLERQLIQSEKLAASGKVAASVAHEINNPIYGIQGCLDHLRKNLTLTERDRKFVELSYQETQRISRLVRMLHDFYHPIEERMIAADINKLINDVLTLQHHSFKLAQIKLITNLDPALPKVLASEDQLKQVFINMVANAQDAMREGGELIISTNNEKDNVAISFSETGLGIPAANKEKIFEAFFTTKKEVKGVGLGLSVSYGIILRHRGSITVEDVSPHGAKFIIRLPVSPIGEPNES